MFFTVITMKFKTTKETTIPDIIYWPFYDFLSNTKFGLDFEVSNFHQKLLPSKIR